MGNANSGDTIKFSKITVRNKLNKKISEISVQYAAGNKLQMSGYLATEYWFDWKTVDIESNHNAVGGTKKTVTIDEIDASSQKSANGFEASTYYRGYWMIKFKYNGKNYKINKNNAMVNVWRKDDNSELELTIMEEDDWLRLHFLMKSGQSYFYFEEY